MKIFLLISFCLLLFGNTSFCQQSNDNNSIEQENQLKKMYLNYVGAQASIYNGRQYIPYHFLKEGHPFFLSDTLSDAWISYEGNIYNIPMQYDVARDQVIISNLAGGTRIFLQNERIDSFHFLNHTFLRLIQNPNENLENTGFYDVLYKGNVVVLAFRKKSFTESIQASKVVRYFNTQDRFFILKNGKYHPVKNEREVFEILEGNSNEIKKLLRRQGLKFRKSKFENALIMAATISDQSKH